MANRFIHSGWCCAAIVFSSAATASDLPVPEALATAFKETCLGGQPSLQGVKWAAVAAGWTAQPVRVVSTSTGARLDGAAAPVFLKKNGMTLTLVEDDRGGDDHLCGVSTSTEDPLTAAALAEALSAASDLGEAAIVPDEKGERALWRLVGGIQIEASVRRKGSLRNASLVAGPTARRMALRD